MISHQKVSSRSRAAKERMDVCPFYPQSPIRVEEFGGVAIPQTGRQEELTDFHVVDARGRTIMVIEHNVSSGEGLADRRERADWYAAEMNALLA